MLKFGMFEEFKKIGFRYIYYSFKINKLIVFIANLIIRYNEVVKVQNYASDLTFSSTAGHLGNRLYFDTKICIFPLKWSYYPNFSTCDINTTEHIYEPNHQIKIIITI